ncbi:aminobenzoyl-glutamate utilization protein A [Halogranum amylolyticum]|uniref:Aminobenzoyl-glutamate utilization protein A n=1 Tax=Halogranum amylolyticum TaxID=660520 RepID=A0A1H8UC78_9EURY|nr:amidohydrolase [Halogranum amylolyticum]SEP00795.1 aminobenzoyl-glutamate utilization protein A [Halogranum amylolyticum]
MPEEMDLVELRRQFHQYPEPGWCEFLTTVSIVEELERLGVDEIHVGPDALETTERLGVPDEEELSQWFEKAKSETDRMDILTHIEGGNTGAVAVVDRGEGPTIGLRVDIDALPIEESRDSKHTPAAKGFRSNNVGFMHACGHDAHITFGLGTLRAVLESDFSGTFKVFFQPSEELLGGGKPMAAGPHIDDVEYLIGAHIGLDYPTGTVVAGLDGALALSRFDIIFEGESAHAGFAPNDGRNAVQALVTAANDMYGIPRHKEGSTRVNVGNIHSENPANVIAHRATANAEVRGESTELMEYMRDAVYRCLNSAADLHECTVEASLIGESIRQDCDEELVSLVSDVAESIDSTSTVLRRDNLGASEDVTYLLKAVVENGGKGTYIGIGGSNPSGHHTPTFDIDEESLSIGVSVLSQTALELLS